MSQNQLKPYLAEMVNGTRTENLTDRSARKAMETILAGDYHPVTLGAFLTAAHLKAETIAELAAFIEVIQQKAVRQIRPAVDRLLDCVPDHMPALAERLMLPAAVLAAAGGTRVVLHRISNPAVEDQTIPGSDLTARLLTACGIKVDESLETIRSLIETQGIAVLDHSLCAPRLQALRKERKSLGITSCFDRVEPFINPATASACLASANPGEAKRLAQVLRRANTGIERAVILHRPPAVPQDDFAKTASPAWTLLEGQSVKTESEFGSLPLDLDRDSLKALPDEPRQLARLMDDLFESPATARTSFRQAVVTGAGLLHYAAGTESTLEHAAARARRTLFTGKPWDLIHRWRRKTPASGEASTSLRTGPA